MPIEDNKHTYKPTWLEKLTSDQLSVVEKLRQEYEAMLLGIPTWRYSCLEPGLKSARGQPEAVESTLKEEAASIAEVARQLASTNIQGVTCVGCGDSYFAALSVRLAFEVLLRRPFDAMESLDFSRYYHRWAGPSMPVIAVSSSGVVQRTMEALYVAKACGSLTLAVTVSRGSPLEEAADLSIVARAQRGGPPTQSSTASMAALYLLALDVAAELGSTPATELEARREELYSLPNIMKRVVRATDEPMRKVAQHLKDQTNFNFVGAGPNLGTVHFGYAKVREASWDHSMPWQSEEYDHEIAYQLPAGEPVFLVAPQGESYDRNVEIARNVRRDRGFVVSVLTEGDKEISRLSDVWIEIPPLSEIFTPLAYVIPLQLFALHLAIAKAPAPIVESTSIKV